MEGGRGGCLAIPARLVEGQLVLDDALRAVFTWAIVPRRSANEMSFFVHPRKEALSSPLATCPHLSRAQATPSLSLTHAQRESGISRGIHPDSERRARRAYNDKKASHSPNNPTFRKPARSRGLDLPAAACSRPLRSGAHSARRASRAIQLAVVRHYMNCSSPAMAAIMAAARLSSLDDRCRRRGGTAACSSAAGWRSGAEAAAEGRGRERERGQASWGEREEQTQGGAPAARPPARA
jgi:hypothetical protein